MIILSEKYMIQIPEGQEVPKDLQATLMNSLLSLENGSIPALTLPVGWELSTR